MKRAKNYPIARHAIHWSMLCHSKKTGAHGKTGKAKRREEKMKVREWACHENKEIHEHRCRQLILYSSVGEKHFGISTNYAAFVGANSFAHNSLNMRINSHLQTIQLRNLG